jgi:hypothetical protein
VGYSYRQRFLNPPFGTEGKYQTFKMNLKPSSEKDSKHLIRFALIFFGIALLICVTLFLNNKKDILQRQPKADSTESVSTIDTTASVDSSEIIRADQLLVNSFELSWGSDRVNIKEALDNFAGVEGSVNWSISYAEAKLKNNPDLFTAFAHAENKDHKQAKIFDITLLVNRENKRFKVIKAVDNGKILKGVMITMTLALEGGYSQGVNF